MKKKLRNFMSSIFGHFGKPTGFIFAQSSSLEIVIEVYKHRKNQIPGSIHINLSD